MTTTSFAILGLLDLRDWTAYELTQQVRRTLPYVWPTSESQLYAEPKRLQRDGLITITAVAAGPQRTRQMLGITTAGRRALRRWLATEPAAPRMQMEVLVRTLFATAGNKRLLLEGIAATRRSTQAAYDQGAVIVAELRSPANPFRNRLHVNVLWMSYVHDHLQLTLRWVDFVEAEVATWNDDFTGHDPERIDELLDAMLEQRPVLT